MPNKSRNLRQPLFISRVAEKAKSFARETPAGYLARGDIQGFGQRSRQLLGEQFGNPINAASNVLPGAPIAGVTKKATLGVAKKLATGLGSELDNLIHKHARNPHEANVLLKAKELFTRAI